MIEAVLTPVVWGALAVGALVAMWFIDRVLSGDGANPAGCGDPLPPAAPRLRSDAVTEYPHVRPSGIRTDRRPP